MRTTRSRSARCARVGPGYCSATTRSKSRADTSNNPASGSRSVTSTRRSGCSARSIPSACGMMAWAADWNTAMPTVPLTVGRGWATGVLCFLERVEDGTTVMYERIALGSELDPPPCRLEQRNTDLAFELAQLLRDGGGTVGEG